MKLLTFAYDIEATQGLPFINIVEGSLKGMCFLVDSGSNQCTMFESAALEHADDLVLLEDKGTIWGVGGKTIETQYVGAVMEFCGKPIKVPFNVIDDSVSDRFFEETGIRMHSILGTDFMMATNMLIDFVHQRILIAPEEYRNRAA